jgi:hypothetical protein
MFSWLNPVRWWRLHQYWRRWKNINWRFTNACKYRDFQLATDAAKFLVDIALRSNNKKLLLATYESLIICYEQIKLFELALDCRRQIVKSQKLVKKELRKYPLEDKWWL